MKKRRSTTTKTKRPAAPKVIGRRGSSSTGVDTQNALLKRERDELLEQQKAIAEVLRVINASPDDLQQVFAVILKSATRLCRANFGTLYLFEGDFCRVVAMHNAPPALAEFRRRDPVVMVSGASLIARVAKEKRTIQAADISATPAARHSESERRFITMTGARSVVIVPMLKNNELIGMITVFRQEVRPFAKAQVDLLESFAAHAVIAIENTRLLNDLRESLEQQTATADVLSVINVSRGDLQPVFEAMVEKARRLCEADAGHLALPVGGDYRSVAVSAMSSEMEAVIGSVSYAPGRGTAVGRALEELRPIQISDIGADNEHAARHAAAKGFIRTILGVPLLREGEAIGAFGLSRQRVEPFSERQIELVRTFAAQAVIAIENTRLFSELRQSLEQQTATSEVLGVISRSKFELRPILQSVVDTAARLCRAEQAVIYRLEDHGAYRFAAGYSLNEEYQEIERKTQLSPGPGTAVGRAALNRQVVRIDDAWTDPLYEKKEDARIGGVHSMIGVPLMRDGEPIGVIALARCRVEPFSEREIELVTTFADQAVIAIENVRLFEAEQQRTRELTKSFEDLRTAQDRLVQTEKLASLGQLTAGIAHEIKNPLNFVNNFSGLSVELIDELHDALKDAPLDEKARMAIDGLADTLRANLDKIAQHGKRADSIVKNMLLHSREGSGERRPVNVNALVEESLNLAYHGARAEKQGFTITLERSFDLEAGEADVFPQEITRVLLNLISNGLYAATKRLGQADNNGYEPILTASTRSLGDRVEIKIRDNGTGIPAEVKAKMFNPFFTTKPAGEGTGLGLSISHDIIVKQHSGSIEVDTAIGEFTEFRIVLPRGSGSR